MFRDAAAVKDNDIRTNDIQFQFNRFNSLRDLRSTGNTTRTIFRSGIRKAVDIVNNYEFSDYYELINMSAKNGDFEYFS